MRRSSTSAARYTAERSNGCRNRSRAPMSSRPASTARSAASTSSCSVRAARCSSAQSHNWIGGRDQNQSLRLLRQPMQACQVLRLDAVRNTGSVGQCEPAGEVDRAQPGAQLQQREWISAGLLEDPRAHAFIHRRGARRCQQGPCRLLVQPGQPQFGQTRQRIKVSASIFG